jgi:hypothetical protein
VSRHYEDAPPVQRIEVERRDGWIIVSLDGERVWKRLTRDPAFHTARVGFYSNQSPAVPKSRIAFQEVHLLGPWRAGKRAQWFGRNRIDVPIPGPGEPPVVWTLHGGVQSPAVQPVSFAGPARDGEPF